MNLESHTDIAEQREALDTLQLEVTSQADAEYLASFGTELDVAKQALTTRTHERVLTAEGTIEDKTKMDALIRDGSYTPESAYNNGIR